MPWDPFRDILALQDRLGRLHGREHAWNPPVDVYETSDRYVVTAELPGLSREDIHIEVREGELTVRGERPTPAVRPEAYLRMERLQGPFSRVFAFADAIDPERISAEFRDGVLTITLPKSPQAPTRRIPLE